MSNPCCSPAPPIVLCAMVSNPAARSATTLVPNSSFAKAFRTKLASLANSFPGSSPKIKLWAYSLAKSILNSVKPVGIGNKCKSASPPFSAETWSGSPRLRDRICCSSSRSMLEAAVSIFKQSFLSLFASKTALATPPTLPKRSRTSVSRT
ncbi:unnamed protein product [Ectocarpus sp. 4 AP-2014]